jgi:hypothetical protein
MTLAFRPREPRDGPGTPASPRARTAPAIRRCARAYSCRRVEQDDLVDMESRTWRASCAASREPIRPPRNAASGIRAARFRRTRPTC